MENQEKIEKIITEAAEAHALEILGEKQSEEIPEAYESIKDDFESGAKFMLEFCRNNNISEFI